jgi:hypothetical protein
MLTDQGDIKKYVGDQYLGHEGSRPPDGWRFPSDFNSINDETSKLVGEVIPEPDSQED